MAGKIPQNFIDDLLERTDIVELIDARVRLKKTGRNYSARCPFHDEKTPSFSVNPDKQFYYCFGCGAGGNALSFLMDYDRTDFVETIENLARHHGLDVPREESQENIKAQAEKRSMYTFMEDANLYYQKQLRQHSLKEKAIGYLKQRGLSGEIAKQFQIGYAPPGWDNLLRELATNEQSQKLLIEAGMLIEKDDGSKCYDRFRDRLMFPIRDNRGRTIAFGGRVLTDEKPKYLNSPETPIFHKQFELYGLYEARQANRHLTQLIMVEGYMDVVALAQFGITNAVATLGTSAGTAHMEKVFRHCPEVVFCFDGDEAGRKAANRALEAVLPFMEAGRQARFLFLPEGEDPDSLVRAEGKDKFLWHIETSPTLSEYLFELHSQKLDLGRTDDKAKLIHNIMPAIKTLPAGAFQQLMLRSLSEKTGLPIDDIREIESLDTLSANQAEPPSEDTQEAQAEPIKRQKLSNAERSIKQTPVKTAIALLLLYPQLAHTIELSENALNRSAEAELLFEIYQQILETPNITTAAILGQWLSQRSSDIQPALGLKLHFEGDSDDRYGYVEQEYKGAIQQILKAVERDQHSKLIEGMKPNAQKTLQDMSPEEKEAFLAIFKQEK